jgi:lysozyme family protein
MSIRGMTRILHPAVRNDGARSRRSLQAFEGIESNHPNDHGGLTHYGLTYKTYETYKPGASPKDLIALTYDEVVHIITELFALKPGFWRIADQWVMWAVIDGAINSGPAEATKQLQRTLGIVVDGIFGRQTEYALTRINPERLFRQLLAERFEHYVDIAKDPTQLAFLRGWVRRGASILRAARPAGACSPRSRPLSPLQPSHRRAPRR